MTKTGATRHLSKATGIFAIISAIMVIGDYYTQYPALKTILEFCQINYTGAVCFGISGIVLLLLNAADRKKSIRVIANALSLILLAIATITLLEHIFGWNTGLDQLFYKSKDSFPFHGTTIKMDPLLCILFTFLATSFLLVRKKKWQLFIQVLLIISIILTGLIFAVVAAVLFIFQGVLFLRPFFHTSFVFLALFTGIFFSDRLRVLKFSFQRKIGAYFLWVVLLMSIAFLGISDLNQRSDDSAKMVESSSRILSRNQQILNLSQSMEMSTRGYVISGNQIFLDAIDRNIPQIDDTLQALKKLVASSPVQKQRVDSLQELLAHNNLMRKTLIKIRDTQGIDSANIFFDREIIQKRMMGKVYALVANIANEEARLLADRKTEHDKSIHDLARVINLFYFILILLLVISFIIIYKNTRARNKAEAETKMLNDTLQKRVDEKAAEVIEKEKRYRFLIENMREGIQVVDYNWRYLFINDSLLKQSKYSREEDLIGHTMMETYPGIEKTELFGVLEESMSKRIPAVYENEFVYPDGSSSWNELSIQPVPEGLFILSIDISERINAQKEIRDSELQRRLIMNASLEAIICINTDGIVTFWNPQARKIFGWSNEEAIGARLEDMIIPPAYHDVYIEGLKDYKHQRGLPILNKLFETTALNRSGTEFPVELTVHSIRQGSEEFFCGFVRDITERRQSEQVTRQLNEDLEKRATELQSSNTELERFAYVASHDLQEPLRMVSSFLQLLEKRLGPSLEDTNKRYFDFAVDGAERMKKLISNLLEYSRVGNNKDITTEVNFQEVVQTVKQLLELNIRETGARVIVHDLPVIRAIQPQIQQLFQNLISNSLKYHSDQVPHIEIGCTPRDKAYEFYIKDNGIGIDPQYFDRIFVIFQRLHNRNEYSGTGIGLSICKKIVKGHGGKIWVESQPGQGTTFYFTIPNI